MTWNSATILMVAGSALLAMTAAVFAVKKKCCDRKSDSQFYRGLSQRHKPNQK